MLSRKDHGDRAGESPQHIDRSARTEQTHASDVGDTRCATPRAVPAPSTRLFLLLHDGYAADGVTDDLMPDDDLDGWARASLPIWTTMTGSTGLSQASAADT